MFKISLSGTEKMEESVLEALQRSGIHQCALDDVVIPHLHEIGVKQLEDLQYITGEDISKLGGISEIERRKLFEVIRGDRSKNHQCVNDSTLSDEPSSLKSIIVKYVYVDHAAVTANSITTQYVQFELTSSLKDLMEHIATEISLPDDEVIELYCKDGYPLHNNSFMNEVCLRKWQLDEELFVIKRKSLQPNQKAFATLPELDHEIGEETFHIETAYHGDFQVKAYMDSDSPEDIAQKIFSLTDIPVPYMSLYVRRGYNHERLDPFTELQDNDIIRVALHDPQELIQPQGTHFGSKSYNQMVTQTDIGISKFYSILKFLCCPQSMTTDYDFDNLLTYLLDLFGFPPLVYSLRVLYEQSSLSIPGWTAVIEGCYALFKKLLCSFDFTKVPDNQVFELSDYIWAFLIEQSKSITDSSVTEVEQLSLVCPLSGTRILSPVQIFGFDGGPFDKDNVLEKVKRGEDFTDVGYSELVREQDVIADVDAEALLLYFHWEHNRIIYKWRKQINVDTSQIFKEIDINEKWHELPKLLCNLSIVNPSGLFAGNECLTYIDEGRLVFFLGANKGDDEHRRIYDPTSELKDYRCSIKKQVLDYYGRSNLEAKVTSDLTQFVPSKQLPFGYNDSERADAIIKPVDTIRWEPEEAIVVVLDHSGSMESQIYGELGKMTCLQAAKELFNAFVTRTQAYRLHHSFGLTLFSTYVSVKLPITKNSEKFEMSLQDLEVDGGTSLTDAMINGIQQLNGFNCIRRIICLTDGYNSSSNYSYKDVKMRAKQSRVIIDTILITGPEGNEEQKCISHETGGVCVLPQTMNEALSYFEMDTMLSVRERKPGSTFYIRGYDSKCDFVSKAINELKHMKTTSAKSFSTSSKAQSCQQRIMKELRGIIQHPHPDFKVFPVYERIDYWKVLMKGPTNTAYETGVFELIVRFPSKYPSLPPEIRFLTQIHHCNISSTSGRVCHSILGSGYTPATSIRDILSHIYGLLMCPDVDTPLDSTLAVEYGYLRHNEKNPNKRFPHVKYFSEANNYFYEAKRQVQLHAANSFEDLEKELDDLLLY